MKKFFLALLPFVKELDIINDEYIDGAKLVLEIEDIAFFNCSDEPVDKLFATEKLYRRIGIFLSCPVTDRVEQMCFAQTDIAV